MRHVFRNVTGESADLLPTSVFGNRSSNVSSVLVSTAEKLGQFDLSESIIHFLSVQCKHLCAFTASQQEATTCRFWPLLPFYRLYFLKSAFSTYDTLTWFNVTANW